MCVFEREVVWVFKVVLSTKTAPQRKDVQKVGSLELRFMLLFWRITKSKARYEALSLCALKIETPEERSCAAASELGRWGNLM